MRLFLALALVLLTPGSYAQQTTNPPPQDNHSSNIPLWEAHFTPEQLQSYYLVYKNPDVRYLRTVFNAYLHGATGEDEEFKLLSKWDKDYYHSKFVVLSRNGNTFGGTLITIIFQGRPDKVFVAWVYAEGAERNLTLRAFDLGNFTDEDIRRIRMRYKKLLEDKVHAM